MGPGGFVTPRWRVAPLVCWASLVFRAPEGPAAVCAGGRRPAREPSALRASLGASSRSPARPRHRPPAPWQVPPAPFTPVVPGRCVCRWVAARPRAVRAVSFARRRASKPGQAPAQRHRSVTRRPQVSCPALACRIAEPTTNIACNSPATLSNHEFTVLELQHFQTLLKLHPIELHAELGEFPFPWLSLCLRGIALHRWAMHCLVASALLCYLVHWCCI